MLGFNLIHVSKGVPDDGLYEKKYSFVSYSAVNFLWNARNRHSITGPSRRGLGIFGSFMYVIIPAFNLDMRYALSRWIVFYI